MESLVPLTPSHPDPAVVERWLDALAAQPWGEAGRVALLVATPRPKEHVAQEAVRVVPGKGLVEDHRRKSFYLGKHVPGREVSAIALETCRTLGVDPVLVGDNLITEGLDLAELEPGDRVRVGEEVVLARSWREHRPCSVFRQRTSAEAFAVVRQRRLRGALFVVERAGAIRMGDPMVRIGGHYDPERPPHV
ncbi:MAG: sulfurase [Rhodothermales bacterium]|nr:sulfurase [Rhodothermales bacterium]